ncbi:MAG: glycosyl hydrolase family 8 [Nocardioidaceae bacterium]
MAGDPRRSPRRTLAVCALVVLSVLASGCGGSPASTGPLATGPSTTGYPAAAERFLADYVTTDGRVLRHDQGGDIVSEGQAYAMLLAEVAGRPTAVRTIWRWTAAHLQRPDGLLSYHASGSGDVEDANPATDADVLCAYALLRYRGAGEGALHRAGRRIATAVLAHESVSVRGAPVLVAGTWATAPPATVNPSYWMPGVFRALAAFTGDKRWRAAATTAVRLVAQVTADGSRLPPDWAQLSGTALVPIAAPDGSAPVQYGLDAARLPVWFGTGCTPAAHRLAARWWSGPLSSVGNRGGLALSLTGRPVNQGTNPLPVIAAAAGAAAAGQAGRSTTLRARAAVLARRTPTYYGDAWLALGDALLDDSLDPCREGRAG